MIRQSPGGYITKDVRFILEQQMQQYDLLQQQLANTKAQMLALCKEHYQQELQLLQTIPGIRAQSAMQSIAETGGNMDAFYSSSKIVGWAGL